jgi:hypothetical protein
VRLCYRFLGLPSMSELVAQQEGPQDLFARLLAAPHPARMVQSLDPAVLHQIVRHVGLEECGEIVALATPQQLTRIFDADLWRSGAPGQEDLFDADRFGLWLEVLSEAGESVAAQKLTAMDFDFVVAAISRQILVVDQESLMELWVGVDTGFSPDDPLLHALHEHGLEDNESCQFGVYTIVARRDRSWDALVSLLSSLHRDHRAFFSRLMKSCCEISTECITDNGGLYEVLSAEQQIMVDAAGAREERREQQGYVTPSQAAAFLQVARSRNEDLPARLEAVLPAWLRDARRSTPAADCPNVTARESDRSLLPAGTSFGRERLSHIRAQLQFTRENDNAAWVRRNEELAWLANALVAGCGFQSRAFLPAEAVEAVLAACNLGLENGGPAEPHPDFLLRQNLINLFQTGWRIQYEEVCMLVATRLVETLAVLKCNDCDIQDQIAGLHRRLHAGIAAGKPWRERDNLDVIAILDQPAWLTLVNLLDECPTVPVNACAPKGRPALRVAMEFEFIAENRQVAWTRNFAESLWRELHSAG